MEESREQKLERVLERAVMWEIHRRPPFYDIESPPWVRDAKVLLATPPDRAFWVRWLIHLMR